MLVQLIGGVGLFLLGMMLLTDGLKSFAGNALRRALLHFTGSPGKACFAGAAATALVQSSSATTVTVIGFVSAGMLTFPQAVGLVIGASLGNTGTGWIVSLVGLRISLGYFALPIVAAGAFLRLLGRGRFRSLGWAVAGFGLIFVGIQTLQDGMEGVTQAFPLADLPSAGLLNRLLLLCIGFAITAIVQSSSAAVAITLTALHAQSINFEQAASLVIGASIGTTLTAVIASLGATDAAKRTALAYVLFNLAAGLIALPLLPAFLWAIGAAQERLGLRPGAMSLAAFHTAFIGLGMVLFMPWVGAFSRWIERILPDRGPALTRHLDNSVLTLPAVALEATRRALRETAGQLFTAILAQLGNGESGREVSEERTTIHQALEQIQEFFAKIPPVDGDRPVSHVREAQMHAIDHLARLEVHIGPPHPPRRFLGDAKLRPQLDLCREILHLAQAGLRETPADEPAALLDERWLERVREKSFALAELRRQERPRVMSKAGADRWEPAAALELLDVMRWLDRVGYHAWRICHYLGEENGAAANATDDDRADAPDFPERPEE